MTKTEYINVYYSMYKHNPPPNTLEKYYPTDTHEASPEDWEEFWRDMEPTK